MDQITLDRIKTAHPAVRAELLAIYTEICARLTKKVICRFAWVLRSFAEQELEYAKGRTAPGAIVTFARGGQSYHNYGLAVDIVFLVDTDGNGTFEKPSWDITKDFDGDGQADFAEVDFVFNMYGWKGLYKADGKRWDFPHFQKDFGLSISQLQALPKLPVEPKYPILKTL